MTQLNMLTDLLSYVTILSVTTERVVEVAKPFFDLDVVKRVITLKTDAQRLAMNHALAFAAGAGIHTLSGNAVPYFTDPVSAALVVGLLASGGSGMWHDLLGVLQNFKQNMKPPAA